MSITKPLVNGITSDLITKIVGSNATLITFTGGAIGDSTAERMFTQYSGAGAAAFETQAGNYYAGAVDYYDSARTGTFLLESTALAADAGNTNLIWVDDSGALAKSNQFTNNITNDVNSPNCYICSLGINDNPEIVGLSITASDIEAAFKFMGDTSQSEKSTSFMMLNPLGRDAGGDDAGCNILREGITDAIANNTNIKRGVDTYDLERTDNKHLVQAGDEEKGEREAIQSAYYFTNTAAQAIGAKIVSASFLADVVTINLAHIGGTDITAPTSGNGGIGITVDGTLVAGTTLTRTNATTASLTFPVSTATAGQVIKLYIPYGKDGGLAADPDVMRDNSTRALPIQSDVVTVTNLES